MYYCIIDITCSVAFDSMIGTMAKGPLYPILNIYTIVYSDIAWGTWNRWPDAGNRQCIKQAVSKTSHHAILVSCCHRIIVLNLIPVQLWLYQRRSSWGAVLIFIPFRLPFKTVVQISHPVSSENQGSWV